MREKVKNGKGLMFFMCYEDPMVQLTQQLLGILAIVLIYIVYRLVATKYPAKRNGLKTIAMVMGTFAVLWLIFVSIMQPLC